MYYIGYIYHTYKIMIGKEDRNPLKIQKPNKDETTIGLNLQHKRTQPSCNSHPNRELNNN